MGPDWELREAGPPDGESTVLLLPGGMCSAGSYAELMAEPAVARTRLVAATLPGHAGAPPPDDYSIENYARLTVELARRVGADVVVGFSIGASVALEMVTSGGFDGPVVLLGISLSAKDEPAFFHAIVRLGTVLGSLPVSVMAKGAASMVKRTPVSAERQNELRPCRERRWRTDRKRAAHAPGGSERAPGDDPRQCVLARERGTRTDRRRSPGGQHPSSPSKLVGVVSTIWSVASHARGRWFKPSRAHGSHLWRE